MMGQNRSDSSKKTSKTVKILKTAISAQLEIDEFEDMDGFERMLVFTVNSLDDPGIEKSMNTVGEDVEA